MLPIYGGQDIAPSDQGIKTVGQPSSSGHRGVMDHLRRKTIRCDYINTIVLDEADEMLNMGIPRDIETIFILYPDEDRQTVLFGNYAKSRF